MKTNFKDLTLSYIKKAIALFSNLFIFLSLHLCPKGYTCGQASRPSLREIKTK